LAAQIPSVDSIEGLVSANLGGTVGAMLNLFEDVLLFILGAISRSIWGAWYILQVPLGYANVSLILHRPNVGPLLQLGLPKANQRVS
jgi:hypothetical protein